MTNFESKRIRAQAICETALKLADEYGTVFPAHYPGSPEQSREVELLPLKIEIYPNLFRGTMHQSEHVIAERTISREGSTLIEVRWYNQRKASFNLGPGGVIMHVFEPGIWELKFGVDPAGDTVPFLSIPFVEDANPAWRDFKASVFSKWPPEVPTVQTF